MSDKKILVVDDERLVLQVLEQLFRKNGYLPICAQDGETALTLMREHGIRMIFTDLRMPGIDGMEVCRRAKKLDPHSRVYTISAYVNAFSPEQFEEAGFDGQFGKPYDIDDLLHACAESFAEFGLASHSADTVPYERRRTPRTTLQQETLVSVLHSRKDARASGKTFVCSECSVSEGGIRLHSEWDLAVDTDLSLCIGVSGHSRTFLLDGIVRWSGAMPQATRSGERFRAGVEFLASSSDMAEWKRFLAEVFAEQHWQEG